MLCAGRRDTGNFGKSKVTEIENARNIKRRWAHFRQNNLAMEKADENAAAAVAGEKPAQQFEGQ